MAAAGHQAEAALAAAIDKQRRQVHRRHRRLDPDRRERRVLHDRRHARRSRSRARCARTRPRVDRGRHVRVVRRPARRVAEPDGRAQRRRRGARHQEPRSTCRRARSNVENLTALLVYFLTFKRWPRARRAAAARCSRTASRSTTPASAARTSTPGQYVERWGDAGAPRRLLPLQDGLQGPGDVPELSRTSAGTTAPTGRSAAVTRASVARSRTSGIA